MNIILTNEYYKITFPCFRKQLLSIIKKKNKFIYNSIPLIKIILSFEFSLDEMAKMQENLSLIVEDDEK